MALKYGNEVFGDKWIFLQNATNPHRDHLTEEWCRDNFLSFIDKDRWSSNSVDFNSLDYSVWDKLINVIDWNKVSLNATLAEQLKLSMKKINSEISCGWELDQLIVSHVSK